MPRLENGPRFSLTGLPGRCVAELRGAAHAEESDSVLMLFLRLEGSQDWHRLFLQAWIGFWEMLEEEDAFCDFDDLPIIDFTERWQIAHRTIESAECFGGGWQDDIPSWFEIRLDSGTLFATSQNDVGMTVSFRADAGPFGAAIPRG